MATIISTDKPVFSNCAVEPASAATAPPPTSVPAPPPVAAADAAAVAPLDYQLEPKPVSRRRYRRVLWLCGAGWLALAVVFAGYGWWRIRMVAQATVAPVATVKVTTPAPPPPPSASTVTYAVNTVNDAQQRQDRIKSLMTGTPRRATEVVYEEDPAAAAKLLASPSEYTVATPGQSGMSTPQGYQPPAYIQASDIEPSGQFKFTQYPPAELFRGQLTSPAGNQRLVRILLRMRFGSPAGSGSSGEPKPQQLISLARQLGFEIYRNDSGNWLNTTRSGESLKIVQAKGENIPIRWVDGVLRADRAAEHNVRFYAGQLDPKDPSHFTIDYELNGERNVIDGWLTDDDFLRIRPRGGKVAGGDWRIAEKP